MIIDGLVQKFVGSDISKVFACSEAGQTAGEFVVRWHVGEMTRLFKIDGFKLDPDEKNPRQTENAMRIPNDMPMDTVGAFGVRYLVIHCENDANAVSEAIQQRNAFDVLRDVNKTYDWLPQPK